MKFKIVDGFGAGVNGRSPLVRHFRIASQQLVKKHGGELDEFAINKSGVVHIVVEDETAATALLEWIKKMTGVTIKVIENEFEEFLAEFNAGKEAAAKK